MSDELKPLREGSHYFGCPTGETENNWNETLCTCPRKEKTDYRLLFADKELLKSAEEINDRLCEMEPDQSWSEIDTCMVAFARMIDLGYTKPSPISPDPLASIAESLERLAEPGVCVHPSPDTESEKFFRHLNNGEVELVPTIAYDSWVATSPFTFRITITEKGKGN